MAESLIDFDFGTGLFAGALGTLALWGAARFWVHALLPRMRWWLYRGVNISGEWKGLGTGYTPAHGEWSELVLRLQQDMHEVHGVVTLRCRSRGRAFDIRLRATGTVNEAYLALSLQPAGESLPSPATALLKVENGGKALNGQLLCRHPFLDIVDVIDLSMQRTQVAVAPQARPASVPATSDASTLPAGTVVE